MKIYNPIDGSQINTNVLGEKIMIGLDSVKEVSADKGKILLKIYGFLREVESEEESIAKEIIPEVENLEDESVPGLDTVESEEESTENPEPIEEAKPKKAKKAIK